MTLPTDNRSFWDRMYSKDPDIFGSKGSEFARWSLPFLQREWPGGRIVELGCGTGRDMMYFAEHGFDVRGVDLSEVATRLANRRLAALRDSSLFQWAVQGDAAEYLMRLSANGVDVVYSNLFFNMETEEQRHFALFHEVDRVLRPQGLHLFSVRSTTDPWYGRGKMLGPDTFDPGSAGRPMRYFSDEYVRRISEPGFDLLALRETREGEDEFPMAMLYVQERTRGGSPPTLRPRKA